MASVLILGIGSGIVAGVDVVLVGALVAATVVLVVVVVVFVVSMGTVSSVEIDGVFKVSLDFGFGWWF